MKTGKLTTFLRLLHIPHSDRPRHTACNRVSPPAHFTSKIRIVSYNIKFSAKVTEAINLFKTNEFLRGADIVCLQEMNIAGVERIAEELGYNFVYYMAAAHLVHRTYLGNAVLSKWPIIDDEKIILPHAGDAHSRRIAVRTTVDIQGRHLVIFSVHKEVFMRPVLRRRQIKTIINAIPDRHHFCVIAGDFNTFRKSTLKSIIESFVDHEFELATGDVGWTYRHWYLLNLKSFLDHIFVRGFKVISSGKVNDRTASDHLPVWTELQLIEHHGKSRPAR